MEDDSSRLGERVSSPFSDILETAWVAHNDLAFAVLDRYPVSRGHTLVVSKRVVPTWFDATEAERRAILALVDEVKANLDAELHPDGYNVGFNSGEAAGQTVMHLHVHVIPRFRGDMDDPRGGVRHVIPSEGNYLRRVRPLATGGTDDPFSRHVLPLFERASEVAIVAAFIQTSGLDRLREPVQRAVARGASVRLVTGDYLGITQVAALETLVDWQAAAPLATEDEDDDASTGTLTTRVIEVETLPPGVRSFHPKAWRFEGPRFGTAFVGSSNLSWAALGGGIEWNLRVDRDRDAHAYRAVRDGFEALWARARPLTAEWVQDYARRARERSQPLPPGELYEDTNAPLPTPHDAQAAALTELRAARGRGQSRALTVFATGLGKTLVAVLDYAQVWDELGRTVPPRLLFLAHRRELLLQAAGQFRALLRARGASATVGWCAESSRELHADLVFASVAKLARTPNLDALRAQRFDYVVVDEVHHAAARSYRAILEALAPGFLLGLTATPERADGADVLGLFDDYVAHRAGIDVGIALERLVPFRYFGVKDSIDYANLPWRNRRFDPDELAAAAQTEARMETLWAAWQAHPGTRTLVFCCSVAHADFVRAWLRERGVRAKAVHSEPTADDRSTSIEELGTGAIDAVCAVDVLNEGVDVPAIDRVVMLRPTESGVVFLQQLGRGLRADDASGKTHLTVIDFVGNHRVFLDRLRALFSLGGCGAGDLRHLLSGETAPELPEGCSVDIELEAKDVLSRLFRQGGADAVERAYRELTVARGERPPAGELFRMGYSPSSLRLRHRSWFEFVRAEGDLAATEAAVLEHAVAWLRELETTPLTRSFKMVTLQALIEHGALVGGMSLDELAVHAHGILRRDPRLLRDVPEELRGPSAGTTPAWRGYWRKNPIEAWSKAKAGGRAWFRVDGDRFLPAWHVPDELVETLASMITEVVDLRLAQYRRRGGAVHDSFECKVTWNRRDPILKLPPRAKVEVPEGEIDARLDDGSVWMFRLSKEFCNVARPAGRDRNQLPDLLRTWFGPSAGQPGTAFHVRFAAGPDGWSVRPEQGAQIIALPRHAVRAYPTLRAAAGHVETATLADEDDVVELPIDPSSTTALFAVRVAGNSMDGGRAPLRAGDWAVFRPARGARATEVEGRVVLVQVPAETDAHGYQIKRVTRAGRGWRLTSDNPSGPSIEADASMVVVARLERAFAPEQLAPERGSVLRENEIASAFGIEHVEPRTARFGGHLFLFLEGADSLVTPTEARAEVRRLPAETAFVLGRVDETSWRFLGVGRFDDATGRWVIPEVDAATWRALGDGGVSRPLPPGSEARASDIVVTLLELPETERWIEQPRGARARVLGAGPRGGLRLRLGAEGEEGRERSVSLTDLAWVVVAADDVAAHGGLLDEARVNRLRYLEGASKASTRYIDTPWAIAAWSRARPHLRQRTERRQVIGEDGRPLDARFHLERRGADLALIVHSRGGTGGSADERNSEYNDGLRRLLERLARVGARIEDALVDSEPLRERDVSARRLVGDDLHYPLTIADADELRRTLGRAMARVGRKPGAKGGGNMTKRLRLLLRWPSYESLEAIAAALSENRRTN